MHANNQKKEPIQPKMTFSDFTWKYNLNMSGVFFIILWVVYGGREGEENPHIQNEKKQ